MVCVHGLTRNGRDFDHLAAVLSADARVICPDIVGRGRSDRLADPEHYALPTYIAHMIQLIERLGLDQVDWVGTSMGGLIGMGVAVADAAKIRRLVLNDVGPFLPKAALERINTYLGLDLRFADLAALEAHLRAIHAGFGPLSDAEWRHLAEHSALARADGTLGAELRPAPRRAAEAGADRGRRPVAGLGPDPLPGPGAARRRERSAARPRPPPRWRAAAPAPRSSRSTAPAMRRS